MPRSFIIAQAAGCLLACGGFVPSAVAQEKLPTPPPVPPASDASVHPTLVAYLMDRSGEAHGMSNGRIHHVVSGELGSLIVKRGKDLLREALTLSSDTPYPQNPRRFEELAVLVLSGIQPEGDGWISEERRKAGAVVFKIPLGLSAWFQRDFPEDRTKVEWMKYLESFDRTEVPEFSRPSAFDGLTIPGWSGARRGFRDQLLDFQDSLRLYREKAKSGQGRPDPSAIAKGLPALRQAIADIDAKRYPDLIAEMQAAVAEAEAFLKSSQQAP